MKKTAEIKAMVEPETKKRLTDKAKALGLSTTQYIEKIANEPIIFLGANEKLLLQALGKVIPDSL